MHHRNTHKKPTAYKIILYKQSHRFPHTRKPRTNIELNNFLFEQIFKCDDQRASNGTQQKKGELVWRNSNRKLAVSSMDQFLPFYIETRWKKIISFFYTRIKIRFEFIYFDTPTGEMLRYHLVFFPPCTFFVALLYVWTLSIE